MKMRWMIYPTDSKQTNLSLISPIPDVHNVNSARFGQIIDLLNHPGFQNNGATLQQTNLNKFIDMVKEQILQTAIQQYEMYGIKGVSMNEIAGKLRISKKTIYCEFRSKEEIITESLLRKLDEGERETNRLINNSHNALEVLVRLGQGIGDRLARICPAFFKDLSRFPEAYSRFIEHKENLDKRLAGIFDTGVQEGLFRKEENYEVIVKIYLEQLQHPATPYKGKIINTFLRGICTPEGIQLLDTLK